MARRRRRPSPSPPPPPPPSPDPPPAAGGTTAPGELPAPPGMTFAALAQAVGVSTHTLRHWSRVGLLPPADFRGRATVYGRPHLVAAKALAHLRYGEHLRYVEIHRRLRGLVAAELEALAGLPPPAPAPPPPSPDLHDPDRYRASLAHPRQQWDRILLCPGVELHVRQDADTEARRLADLIVARHATPGPPAGGTP